MKTVVITFLTLGFLLGCKTDRNQTKESIGKIPDSNENSLPMEEGEWQNLLEGSKAEGWRGFNEESGLPDGWVLEEGVLRSLGKGGDIGGDIVYGEEEFGEFELFVDWKISPDGNSGIFYHVQEGEEYEAPYFTGPEYQIRHHNDLSQEQNLLHSLGADYGMYEPQLSQDIIKKAGEWNTSRIIFTHDEVSYWLNGKKTVEFKPWSQEWQEHKLNGKWKDFPGYGEARKGLIGLQDHGSEIWFKNIRIRKL